MCLTTTQKWPKIAWKPITTYKVVCVPDNYPSLVTLCLGFPVDIGKTYKETLRNIFSTRERISIGYEMYCGLHSYTREYTSRLTAHYYKNHNTLVVKCIIPKFSLYWIGDNGDIVSNKLKYVKIL